MQILTLLLAIKGIYLSRQTYFLGDFNIFVQIMSAGVSFGMIVTTDFLNINGGICFDANWVLFVCFLFLLGSIWTPIEK